jgi:hypothetical protein
MEEKQTAPLTINKTVFRFAVLVVVLIILFLLLMPFSPLPWSKEFFTFQSGPHCFVFPEPKLVILIGDDGEEVFDYINSGSFGYPLPSESVSNGVVLFSCKGIFGNATIKFLNGKYVMNVSSRGTKLTLADGRTFTLDGKTPLWLRCKSDGTIIELDELPEGLIKFFETHPEFSHNLESYPEAFRK